MSTTRQPGVTFHPAMIHGDPTINATRIPLWAFAGQIWNGEPVDRIADDYDITREDVLIGCWFLGSYGIEGRTWTRTGKQRQRIHGSRVWRSRWGDWAAAHGGAMWRGEWDQIPDPPSAQDLEVSQ